MNKIKILIVLLVLPLFAFTNAHKFYVSVTQIEYVKEKKEVQIITRVFIDDMEKLIRERYDETIVLAEKNEPESIDNYIKKYLKEKLGITINSEAKKLHFLGKEYEDDMVICYLEISDVSSIKTLEVSNTILFDLYSEQQNVIRAKVNSKSKSLILIPENDKGLLNFN